MVPKVIDSQKSIIRDKQTKNNIEKAETMRNLNEDTITQAVLARHAEMVHRRGKCRQRRHETDHPIDVLALVVSSERAEHRREIACFVRCPFAVLRDGQNDSEIA